MKKVHVLYGILHTNMHVHTFTQYSSLSTVHPVQFTQYSSLSTVHPVQFTQYSSLGTVHPVQFTQYSSPSTVPPVQFTQYSSPSTVHSVLLTCECQISNTTSWYVDPVTDSTGVLPKVSTRNVPNRQNIAFFRKQIFLRCVDLIAHVRPRKLHGMIRCGCARQLGLASLPNWLRSDADVGVI